MFSFGQLALIATLALTTFTSAVPVPLTPPLVNAPSLPVGAVNPPTSIVVFVTQASNDIKPWSDRLGRFLSLSLFFHRV
jgi:hypothetical protein